MRNSRTALSGVFLFLFAGLAVAQAPGDLPRDGSATFRVGGSGPEVRIAAAWGEQLRPAEAYPRALINLRDAMEKWTSVPVTIEKQFRIGSTSLSDIQILFVMPDNQFQLSETEKENLKRFIKAGGFIIIDDAGAGTANHQSLGSIRDMVKAISGGRRLEPIPTDHEIYTTPFFFGGPPQGSDNAIIQTSGNDGVINDSVIPEWKDEVKYIEGVSIDGRLAIICSEKGYVGTWNDELNESQLKFGVNLIMYAAGKQ